MSSRLSYYYRQKVSEDELNLGFALLEKADHDLAADLGIFGIVSGAIPTQHEPVADLSIDLTAPARGYDRMGQRLFFGTGQTINCAVDHAGVPTDIATAGQERWLGVFLRFTRLLADPRTDGHSRQVFFRQEESFEIIARQGIQGPAGAALRVPLEDDELLICDIRLISGQSQITDKDIDTSRRQSFVFARASAIGVAPELWKALVPKTPTVQSALDDADNVLSEHLTASARRHRAQDIDYVPRRFISSSNVKGALDDVVDKLSSATPGASGADRIGVEEAIGIPGGLAAGSVGSQIRDLLSGLNSHVGAITRAHDASAIGATAHNFVMGPSVQAQLKEIAEKLGSMEPDLGAGLIGNVEVAGIPYALPQANLQVQIQTLLDHLNAHNHDARYLREAYRQTSKFAAGESRRLIVLPDSPEVVTVGYSYLSPEGMAEATIYHAGTLSSGVHCWTSKVTGNANGQFELWGHNETAFPLYLVVAAYWVAT